MFWGVWGRRRKLIVTSLRLGSFRLRFDTNVYFSRLSLSAFYPHVTIDFVVANASEHYHVPLLLNPYGYSTYRGS